MALRTERRPSALIHRSYTMTDKKITALTQGIPVANDVFPYVSSPGASPETKKTLYDNGGWIGAVGSWTYASATTITVPSGAATYYAVGDKIKLTQTTVKYFYVVAVADTLLTITGGTSYTLANAAITLPYFSHAASPVGHPGKFAYSPTLTFTAGTAPTTVSASSYFFSLHGNLCTVSTLTLYTNAGSTVTAVSITLPVPHASTTGFASYGQITSGSTPNLTYNAVVTTMLLNCSSVSANRVVAGASYFI